MLKTLLCLSLCKLHLNYQDNPFCLVKVAVVVSLMKFMANLSEKTTSFATTLQQNVFLPDVFNLPCIILVV